MLAVQSEPTARISLPRLSQEAKRFQCGESAFNQSGNIIATAWKDKVVNVASTLGNPTDLTTVKGDRRMAPELTSTVPSV